MRRETKDGRRKTGDGRKDTGHRRQETGDIRREAGFRRQETGDRGTKTRDGRGFSAAGEFTSFVRTLIANRKYKLAVAAKFSSFLLNEKFSGFSGLQCPTFK